MLLVPTFVGPSEISGLGLFFATDLPKGTLLWQFDEKCDKMYLPSEFEALDREYQDEVDWVGYLDKGSNLWLICGDDARYTNHSYSPSALAVPDKIFTMDIAITDLKAGQEYTADYSQWDAKFDASLYR